MSFNDKFLLIKKSIFDKKNLIFFFVLSILFTIVILSLTTIHFVVNYKNNEINKNPLSRTLFVEKKDAMEEEYDELSNLEHVVFNVNSKFSQSLFIAVPVFDSNEYLGELNLIPLLDESEIKIMDGKKLDSLFDVICPKKFYPHNLYIQDGDNVYEKIDTSKMLHGIDTIGISFPVIDLNQNEFSLTIVGTYEQVGYAQALNTCYVNQELFDKLATDYDSVIKWTDVEGKEYTEYNYFQGRILRIDDFSNLEKIENKLRELGFHSTRMQVLDDGYLELIFNIPLFICIISFLICVNVIYSFFAKKIQNRIKKYGLLRALGYTKHNITCLDFFENGIVVFGSICFSYILSYSILIIIKNNAFFEFSYYGLIIRIPIVLTILSFLMIFLFILLINRGMLQRKLSNPINLMLGDD